MTARRYSLERCRRVRVIGAASGEPVVGIEDLALDRGHDRLFLSAYDRHAVETAARKRAPTVPQGGIYALSYSALIDGGEEAVEAAPAIAKEIVPGGLRPVGISYNPETDEIAFINRGFERAGGEWRMTARVHKIVSGGAFDAAPDIKAPLNANNILAEGNELLVSFDHGLAGFGAKIEEALSLKRSGVAGPDGRVLFDRCAYANGIARSMSGNIALAGTRERALVLLARQGDELTLFARIETPGGPDNVTVADDGALITAVHPNMLKIGLNRLFGIGKAPTRVVRVDPKTRAVEILFDDPQGSRFSAATVAVESRGALVLGSVTDEGLLVCGGGA